MQGLQKATNSNNSNYTLKKSYTVTFITRLKQVKIRYKGMKIAASIIIHIYGHQLTNYCSSLYQRYLFYSIATVSYWT